MTTDNWKVQWSFKSPSGDLVNVRANSAEELSILLEGIAEVAGQASATSKAIEAVYTLAPLSTGGFTSAPTPPPSFATNSAAPAFATEAPLAPPTSGPTCLHGPRKFLSGISKKNGQPYKMWVCTQPQGTAQCSPVNG